MNPRRILLLLAICCLTAAAPVLAAPACSQCNCSLSCGTQCSLGNGQWSICLFGPDCREMCDFGSQAAATAALSEEAFLESLAAPETAVTEPAR